MNTNTSTAISSATTTAAPVAGIGSTLVIASGTAFLMLASTAAVWTKVEPVILLVARYTG